MVVLLAEIRRSPVGVGSLSHYLQGVIHPRWLFGISEPSTVPYVFSNRVLQLKLALRYNSTKPTIHLQGDSTP